MPVEEHMSPSASAVLAARAAVSRAAQIRRRLIIVAEAVAESEEQVAATLARIADRRPHDAARLRAKSEVAAQTAARERRWAAEQHGRRAGDNARRRTTLPHMHGRGTDG
jgi:hypothetical protein